MAVVKTAHVVRNHSIGADSRLLELQAAEPLGFAGGQYVIVDSGLTAPSGKAVKRAYSPISADREQQRFELLVKRIAGGLGSAFVHALQPGAQLRFSGPWGKLAAELPADGGPTLVLATDTGITAALGLVRGVRFAALLPATTLIWLRVSGGSFAPDGFVRARVPSGCNLRIDSLPASDHPERVPYVRALVQQHARRHGIARAFVAGDGAVNYALLDDLTASGIAISRDHLESFFNMPKKSA